MLVTLNWLKDFVDISDTPQNIADKLTLAGMEVEEIVYQDRFIDHVRIGKFWKSNNIQMLTDSQFAKSILVIVKFKSSLPRETSGKVIWCLFLFQEQNLRTELK